MERRYVPLRSATPPTGYAGPIAAPESAPLKKRRTAVSIACNDCRKRKVRCDGARPVCSNCHAQKIRCEYRNDVGLSKESKDIVLEMIASLNQLPVSELVPLLRGLRAEDDAATVLAVIREPQAAGTEINGVFGPSAPAAGAAASSGEVDGVVDNEDELSRHHPAVYPRLAEPEPYLFKTKPYERLISTMHGSSSEASSKHSNREQREDAALLCDPRLHDLNMAQWSTVDIANDLAAKCISLYLKTDHPLLGHFDPNLFISDLVAGRTRFCSSLLVNALLYWGCQMFSAIEPHTDDLTLPFCAEAERLWLVERQNGRDSPLNMAATVFLSMGYLGQGRDHSVLEYLSEATEMGTRMGLFGTKSESSTKGAEKDEEATREEMHASWGVFNWTVLMSLFYHQPGIHIPSKPPRMPIPDKSSTPPLLSPYMGYTFPYLCRFWRIMHEVGTFYHENGDLPWGSRSSLAFAEYKFRELLAWSDSLPNQHGSQHGTPHHVKIMHIWFHTAVLDIFRPIIHKGSQREKYLRTFADETHTPVSVYSRSTAQLKQLLVDYRLNYASSSFTILWHTALIYVANSILEGDHNDNWYSYILFCLYGYERLSKSWRVARAISKGLLSMAIRTGHMSSDAARRILRDLESGGDHGDDDAAIRATFMLDLTASTPASSTVEQLADSFEENADLQDFTNVFDNAN